jgi:plasmid stabilization system protein ParE
MSKTVRFHPEARVEFRQSAIWYKERSPQAAASFRATVSEAVLTIRDVPQRYATYLYGTRRYILRNFPFSIIYLDRDSIEIVAIAHHKRKPGYWKARP